MADSDGAEHSATIEEAVARHRAEVVTFPSGYAITQGELDDMESDSRQLFIHMMFDPATSLENIE